MVEVVNTSAKSGGSEVASAGNRGSFGGVQLSGESVLRHDVKPWNEGSRTVQTLFHPQPPTNAQFDSVFNVAGFDQAYAASIKDAYTQTFGQLVKVFSEPIPQPGNNPSGVNVTATPPRRPVIDTNTARGRGRFRELFGNWFTKAFPNG